MDPATERRRLWQLEVRDLPVLDLRRAEAREALDIGPSELVGAREHAQGAAATSRALGAHGMVVPSAARADAWNLVVFPIGFDHVSVGRGRAMRPRPPSVSRRGGAG